MIDQLLVAVVFVLAILPVVERGRRAEAKACAEYIAAIRHVAEGKTASPAFVAPGS